mgnify:CR=1 FL=1
MPPLLLSACLSAGAAAQTLTQLPDPLHAGPRGLVDTAAGMVPPADARAAGVTAASVPPGAPAQPVTGPLPVDPAQARKPVMFGSQMFVGRGAFNFDATQPVDAQGNIFIPNVGPIRVLGVRNADLVATVEREVKRTFRASVGVYATLEGAQPVKIYVTGFVRAAGLYGGLSSNSGL